VENKTAIKINYLIVTRRLNILCKHGGVKWHNCCQCTIHITQLLTCNLSTQKTSQQMVSTSIQLTF